MPKYRVRWRRREPKLNEGIQPSTRNFRSDETAKIWCARMGMRNPKKVYWAERVEEPAEPASKDKFSEIMESEGVTFPEAVERLSKPTE